MKTCAFIGLGSQGAPMARRMIHAGYPVRLWARRRETLDAFSDTDATIASSITEVGQAQHVGICVVDDRGVQEICDALIPVMQPGGLIAIHSTVDPRLCISLAQLAAVRGIALIDAPVSGGGPAASAGKLTVMVGGDKAAVDAARPVFETFSSLIAHLGTVGTGQMAKLVNNALMAAHVAIADHALSAAAALNIDRAAFIELVKASSGRSFGFEVYSRQASPQAFAHGAKLLAKDIHLLGESLSSHAGFEALKELTTPFLRLATQTFGDTA